MYNVHKHTHNFVMEQYLSTISTQTSSLAVYLRTSSFSSVRVQLNRNVSMFLQLLKVQGYGGVQHGEGVGSVGRGVFVLAIGHREEVLQLPLQGLECRALHRVLEPAPQRSSSRGRGSVRT